MGSIKTPAEIAEIVAAENTKLLAEVTKLVQDMPGGVLGLLKQFHDKGLGNVASALSGNVATRPTTPQQIVHGLGTERIEALATASGLNVKIVRARLVEILPKVVRVVVPAKAVVAVAAAGSY